MIPLPDAFLTKPIAHRGLHDERKGIAENSRAACAAAIAGGYGIEIDIQMSADGAAMVFHDGDLDRLTYETGAIGARTSAELESVLLRTGGEAIPALADVLELVAGRAPLLIEIKDRAGASGPRTEALARAVAGDLDRYDGPVAVMSFNPAAVASFRNAAPKAPRGLVTCAFHRCDWPDVPARALAALAELSGAEDAGFISHDHRDLGNPRVAELKAAGMPVLCWTIRGADEEEAARRHADNITFEGYLPSS